MARTDERSLAPLTDVPVSIRAVLNALPAMVGYWDRDLRNVVANHAYVEFFGMSPEEMRGIHISELLGPELFEKNRPYMEAALAGEPQLFDREIRTPSGEVRYTQASYIPDVVDGEVRGFSVLVTDITERKRMEDEIERSRAQFAEAEHLARLGSWEWEIATDRMSWSDGLCEIYGITPDELGVRLRPGDAKWVHPDDRERIEAELRRALEACGQFDIEYRIIRADGRVRRLHSRGEVIADAEGRPVRMAGTAQDVTEARAAEEALDQTAAALGTQAARLQDLARAPRRGHDDVTSTLTPRQVEILRLVAEGFSNAEIGQRLFLSESTVKWHMRKILGVLGVHNRAQAVVRYLATQPPAPA
jgi:PAS domain S-box-containing protein